MKTDHPFPSPPDGRRFGVARKPTGLERIRAPLRSEIVVDRGLSLAEANEIAQEDSRDTWVFVDDE